MLTASESESPTPNQRIAKRSCPAWPSCGTKPRWSHPSALPGGGKGPLGIPWSGHPIRQVHHPSAPTVIKQPSRRWMGTQNPSSQIAEAFEEGRIRHQRQHGRGTGKGCSTRRTCLHKHRGEFARVLPGLPHGNEEHFQSVASVDLHNTRLYMCVLPFVLAGFRIHGYMHTLS